MIPVHPVIVPEYRHRGRDLSVLRVRRGRDGEGVRFSDLRRRHIPLRQSDVRRCLIECDLALRPFSAELRHFKYGDPSVIVVCGNGDFHFAAGKAAPDIGELAGVIQVGNDRARCEIRLQRPDVKPDIDVGRGAGQSEEVDSRRKGSPLIVLVQSVPFGFVSRQRLVGGAHQPVGTVFIPAQAESQRAVRVVHIGKRDVQYREIRFPGDGRQHGEAQKTVRARRAGDVQHLAERDRITVGKADPVSVFGERGGGCVCLKTAVRFHRAERPLDDMGAPADLALQLQAVFACFVEGKGFAQRRHAGGICQEFIAFAVAAPHR